MVNPIIGNVIIALIQIVGELAKQQGMTIEQVNQHFLESWQKVEDRSPDDLPDPYP